MNFATLLRPAALALVIAAPLAQAQTSATEKCLAASFYPDGNELLGHCENALKVSKLDNATLAKVNLQIGQAIYFSHQPGVALSQATSAATRSLRNSHAAAWASSTGRGRSG